LQAFIAALAIATVPLAARAADNRIPGISSGEPPAVVDAGSFYTFKPYAWDHDGDTLRFAARNLPDWLALAADTGRINGTPDDSDVGVYENVVLSVSDGTASNSLEPFSITVRTADGTAPDPDSPPASDGDSSNTVPGISGSPPTSVVASDLYTFKPYAWDHDGDTLVFSVANKPAWMTLDRGTGRMRGTPGPGDVAIYRDLRISVSDGVASKSLAPFDLTVLATDGSPPEATEPPPPSEPAPDPDNRTPGISGSPPTSVSAGDLYTFKPYAWDHDGDSLVFSVGNRPAWMTVDAATGRMRGTPSSANVGIYADLVVSVTDGVATKSLAPFDLTVLAADGSAGPVPAPEPEPEPTPGPAPEPSPSVDSGNLFVTVASPGSVPVTLHPGSSAQSGQKVVVAFGVPFPKGLVKDVSSLRLTTTDGTELPSHVVELARWRVLGNDTAGQSVRAALFYTEATFTSASPRTIRVEFGRARTQELGVEPAPDSLWVGISRGIDPAEYPSGADIREPAVYATLPADWLSATLLRSRSQPVLLEDDLRWFDAAVTNFAHTAVNDVAASVLPEELIDYASAAEPWLFDRAMTLFGVYLRTGELKWLRHAHRAAQFYARHVTASGAFDLKGSDDLKYSYGQAMLLDLMLTGDRRLVAPIERVASLGARFDATYTYSRNFWTERHQAYALLAALSAWEATGKAEHARRAIDVAQASFKAALEPANGWSAQGCILHTIRQHEGDADSRPICSPWMSALLGEAVWRYYIVSQDRAALRFLADLGTFVARHGIRDVGSAHAELAGLWAPWYLASESVEFSDTGPWGDLEHTCDVAGLTARGAWAAGALGRSPTEINQATGRLLPGCKYILRYWHRTTSATRPEYRLQPPRKFSWWFGSTLDLPWFETTRRN
jgi:hypothetical protein